MYKYGKIPMGDKKSKAYIGPLKVPLISWWYLNQQIVNKLKKLFMWKSSKLSTQGPVE